VLYRTGKVLSRISRGIVAYDRAFIVEGDVTTPSDDRPTSISVEFRLATPEDIGTLTLEEHGYGDTRKELAKEALQRGKLCAIGVYRDQIIHIGWVGFEEFEFAGRKFPIGLAWGEMYDGRTIKQFRNKGLHGAGMKYRHFLALSRGAKRKIGCVKVNDEASWRNVPGDQVIGSMHTILVLRRWRYTWAPKWLGPYLLGHGDRPRV